MPRTVTTLLSSKVLASLPSTTSLLLSHDLHDPGVNMARQTAVTDARSLGQPLVPVGGSEGVSGSGQSMGPPMVMRHQGQSTNPFVTPVDTHDPGNEPASGRLDRSSTRYVPQMLSNAGAIEMRSVHVDDSFEQESAVVEQHRDYNVRTELQRLRFQMDMLLTRARQSQDTFQGVSPSRVSSQVGNDRVVSVPGYCRLRYGNVAQIPASNVDSQPQLPQRDSGVAQSGHQYFAGDRMMDSGYGAMESWTESASGPVEQMQPQLQPWVPDYVRTVGHRDERDPDGYGQWEQFASSYRVGIEDQSSLMDDWQQTQGRNEEASSDKGRFPSGQYSGNNRRHESTKVTQQPRRGSSHRRERSTSSSDSRSPPAGSSAGKRHRSPPLPKLQVFSGKTGEWNTFIFPFKKAALYYGWGQQEKCDRLLTSLRGKAVDFIMTQPRSLQHNFRELRAALERRFNRQEHPITARRQLNYLQQQEGESLGDYADRVFTKVAEAYPGADEELEQDLAKEAFLRGCRNKSAVYAAAEKYPETLQDALEEVQHSEVNLTAFGRGSMATRRVSFTGQEEKDRDAYSSSDEERRLEKLVAKLMKEWEEERSNVGQARSTIRCYKCGSYGHMARGCHKEITCFECGEVGHVRSQCQMSEEQTGSQGRDTDSAPSVRTVYVDQPKDVASAVSLPSERDGQSQGRQFSWSPNAASTMEVPVWIGRRKVMAAIDMAAQVTLINRDLSVELGCEEPVEKVQLRNAQMDSWVDGGVVKEFGFRLGDKKYHWDVVEADIEPAFIIGIDFLQCQKCKIDLASNILEMGNGDHVPATLKTHNSNQDVPVSQVVAASERGEKLDQKKLQQVSAQHGALPASKSSNAAQVRLVQREVGMRSVSEPGATKVSTNMERWAPQVIRGKQSRGSDGKIISNHVSYGKDVRGHRPAVHNTWRSGSQRQAKYVRKRRSRSGFWSPVPQLEEWVSWRDRAMRPVRVKDGCK